VNFIADKYVIHTAIVTLLQHVILNVLYLYIYSVLLDEFWYCNLSVFEACIFHRG